MATIELSTSQKVFEDLHEIADTKSKRPLKIRKEDLKNLLRDHSCMVAKLNEIGEALQTN